MMEKLGIPMPESGMASNLDEAIAVANQIGYLNGTTFICTWGRGMEIVYDEDMLKTYVSSAVGVTPERPILIDRF